MLPAGAVPLLSAVRYEGAFLILVVCVLALARGKIILSLSLAILGSLPVAVYGARSVSHGWFFLPNGILLKGNTPIFTSLPSVLNALGLSAIRNLEGNLPLFFLVFLSLLFFLFRNPKSSLWEEGKLLPLLFVGSALLHLQFASTGWFYRYEAYLVVLGVLVLSIQLADVLTKQPRLAFPREWIAEFAARGLLLLLILVPFSGRTGRSLLNTPQATHDRFLEHILSAEFVTRYYNHSTIILNDIGTMGFYSNSRILDLYGLARLEPIRFRRQPGGYTKEDVRQWAGSSAAKLAFLQIQFPEVAPRIPDEWVKVAEWQIPKNVVFGDTHFGIYAVDPTETSRLIANLRAFSCRLPTELKQSGRYVTEETK